MLDLLMWPWFERAKALTLLYKRCTSLDKEKFPQLVSMLIRIHYVSHLCNMIFSLMNQFLPRTRYASDALHTTTQIQLIVVNLRGDYPFVPFILIDLCARYTISDGVGGGDERPAVRREEQMLVRGVREGDRSDESWEHRLRQYLSAFTHEALEE